jgi:hypothetical protein
MALGCGRSATGRIVYVADVLDHRGAAILRESRIYIVRAGAGLLELELELLVMSFGNSVSRSMDVTDTRRPTNMWSQKAFCQCRLGQPCPLSRRLDHGGAAMLWRRLMAARPLFAVIVEYRGAMMGSCRSTDAELRQDCHSCLKSWTMAEPRCIVS